MAKIPDNSQPWPVLGRVLLFFLGCAAMLALMAPFSHIVSGRWSLLFLGTAASVGVLALSVLFVRWEKLRLADIGAAPGRDSLTRLALGFLIGLFLVALRSFLVGLTGHVQWVRAPGTGPAPTAITLLAYLALSCREEMAFRGYPLRRLERPFGPWGAQIIVATVFAIEHVAGGVTWPHALLGAFAGSILFGMAALATRGLAMPIGLHAAWNFGQWIIGEKESPGLWKPVIDEGYKARVDHAGLISYLLVTGLATLAFWWWARRRSKGSRATASSR
jgi:membrane protease YdiL (CAAX protease family)